MNHKDYCGLRCIECLSEQALTQLKLSNPRENIDSIIYCQNCYAAFPVVNNVPYFLSRELMEPGIFAVTQQLFNFNKQSCSS